MLYDSLEAMGSDITAAQHLKNNANLYYLIFRINKIYVIPASAKAGEWTPGWYKAER